MSTYSQYIFCTTPEVAEAWAHHEQYENEAQAELRYIKVDSTLKDIVLKAYKQGESFVFIYPDNKVHLLMAEQMDNWKNFADLFKLEVAKNMKDYLLFQLEFNMKSTFTLEDTDVKFETSIYDPDLSLHQMNF